MSREIKFRAWILNQSRMERCVSVSPFDVSDCDRMYWKHEEVVLEQYVGIKDVNDVGIYEGDLIKDIHGDVLTVKYGEFLNRDVREPYYEFGFHMVDEGGFCFPLNTLEELEVVGNIHDMGVEGVEGVETK